MRAKSPVGYRLIAPPPVPARISEDYKNLVERLASNPPEGILGLSQNARNLFEKWEGEIETMLADGGTMEAMRDWGGKLAGETLRIMAVLHYSDPGSARCASEETVKSAIEIARYFIPHAEYVLNLMQANDSSKVEDATYILRWIKRHDRHEFTKRDAQQDGKRRFPRSDDINEPLAELVQRGFIRELPDESVGPGRPSSPRYEVNPLVFANANPEKRSQYPHNSSKRPENSSSEDIEDTFEQSKKTNRSQVTI